MASIVPLITIEDYRRVLKATLDMLDEVLTNDSSEFNTQTLADANQWLDACRHVLVGGDLSDRLASEAEARGNLSDRLASEAEVHTERRIQDDAVGRHAELDDALNGVKIVKLKPQPDRAASARRNECVVLGCIRPMHGFGFCRECLTELNATLERRPF